MRNFILALVGFFAMGAAQADVVTLGPVGCGIIKQCVNIPNDAALDINLWGAPGYQFFYLTIDGVTYKASQASGLGGTDVVLSDADGNVVYLTYAFSTFHTCVRSGRGQHCSTHYNLTGGSIQK